MNGTHSRNLDKPFPGCLGKMVNMFDFTSGIAGNKLLTDKLHGDESPRARRSLPDVSRLNQFGDHTHNKMVCETARNCTKKKSNATPMKILIAQEMSKELDSRSNPPSVVAKLMGLDTLPHGQSNLATQKSHSRSSSRSNSDLPLNVYQDKSYWDVQLEHDNDASEITRQPHKPNCIREKSPHKPSLRFDELSNDKKMDFVCQKFIQAKRLSTDGNLRQSQEFDDALEVLNSNKELFLKLLQESNSMCFQHLHDHFVPAQPETEKITVLKPCKNEKQAKKGTLVSEAILPQENHSVGRKTDENRVQRTQIVVLKPSYGKPQEIEAVVSSPAGKKPREFTKETSGKMCENLSGHRRDEEFLSSVFSNSYTGDESSFHKSGNLSDVEIKSSASRHSWDSENRFDSPYTMSSFSRNSCSPESSVCREAKKRLSERWAAVTSSENHEDQRPMRTRSSTLGEMLALSNIKNTTVLVSKDNTVDSKDSTSPVVGGSNKDTHISHRRSKSAPVSFTVFGTNVDSPSLSEGNKTNILHETSKEENVKSSLKGKVSSLFFPRSRKSNKGKPTDSQSKDEPRSPETFFVSCEIAYNSSTQYLNDSGYEECSSAGGSELSGQAVSPEMSAKPCVITSGVFPNIGLRVKDPLTCGNAVDSHEQPSPISVLEVPSEEDGYTTTESPKNDNPECGTLSKCILVDKSTPIESVASTLSWDDSSMDTATSYPLQTSLSCEDADEEEEREYFSFVETLLSVAGLNGEIQPDMFMSRWYSFECPIDPSYRDKYIDRNEKDALQEAKRRHIRSTSKLVFDCVNAALVEMAGYGSETCRRAIPSTKPHKNIVQGGSLTLANQVWSHMSEWFSGEEESCFADDFIDGESLMVERIVMKEVLGKGWMEHLRSEMDNIGLGIQRVLLEDLLQETLVEYAVKT